MGQKALTSYSLSSSLVLKRKLVLYSHCGVHSNPQDRFYKVHLRLKKQKKSDFENVLRIPCIHRNNGRNAYPKG